MIAKFLLKLPQCSRESTVPQRLHPSKAPVPNPTLTSRFLSYPIIWPQNTILFQTDDANCESNYTYEGLLNNFLDAIDGSYCTFSDYGITGNTIDPTLTQQQMDTKVVCNAVSTSPPM
jgi:hypothetical protein